MGYKDSGYMRRVRFDDPSAVEYESHHAGGRKRPKYSVILGEYPYEFYYEFMFSKEVVFPKKIEINGYAIERLVKT